MDIIRRIKSYHKLRDNCYDKLKRRYGHEKNLILHKLAPIIGQILRQRIDSKHISVRYVILDILKSVDLSYEAMPKLRICGFRHTLKWLDLHLALDLCYHYKIEDREFVRCILYKLLIIENGLGVSIFMWDLIEWEKSKCRKPVPAKALYFLNVCAGFRVKLDDVHFKQVIYGQWSNFVTIKSCLYLNLPIARPPCDCCYLTIQNDAYQGTPLLVACHQKKPQTVLMLLRFGATAIGQIFDVLIYLLGCSNVHPKPTEIDFTKECIVNVLKTTSHIKSYACGTRMGHDDVLKYFCEYHRTIFNNLPKEGFTTPFSLKHICRCAIRRKLIRLDRLPRGISGLGFPWDLMTYINMCT